MTSRFAAVAVLLSLVMAVAPSNAQTLVLGTSSVLSNVDSDSSGKAEAFRTVAPNSGTVSSVSLYLDSSSRAPKVIVGIYSDSNGHPQTLLGSGTISSPVAGQWNTVAISPAVSVTAGTAYHETVLGTGGTIVYRDTNGGGHSETSAQSTLSALPTTWSSGQSWPSAPISFYGSGSINSGASGGSAVSITVSPSTASISTGGTQQFSATVSGSTNTAVNWSVLSGGGSISSAGLYTAPSRSGSATIQAQSQADTTKTATATVTITSSVAVSISPASVTLSPRATQQFTATVSGTSNTAVNWSVVSGRGSINSSGLYTASFRSGSATIQAQSQADTTRTATATVTVTTTSSTAVSISPSTAAVPQGGTQQFTATVSGSSDSSVTWSLAGIGTLSSSGLYTAPGNQGSATVTATSVADSTKSASASVTVPTVAISVSPISATVQPNGTQQFTASVSGTTNTAVTWSDTGNGSVNSKGLYTAPGSAENDTVTVTSVADSTKSATAGVTVQQQSSTQCGNTLNWTSSTCQQIGSGQLNTAVVNGVNDPNAWTVISRHGEYAQNETECNVPGAISAGRGQLTITTSAQSATCGDFNPDGTTRNSPQSWPYTTGDLQFNTFNFKYGTIIYSASLPTSATHLWPGLLWLLTSACQTTNKYTGDIAIGSCPGEGSGSGYTEIDPLECYNAGLGWCQFNVANPSFGQCDWAVPISDSAFHTIMVVWSQSSIKQYTDGNLTGTCNQSLSAPMFAIVQTQTGGIGGTPNNSLLPATATMQYVKVCSSTDGSCATVHDNDPSVEFVDRFGGPPQ